MSSYSAGQSVRGISADDTLGIYSALLPYDMGGFRINTTYPIGVAPVASGTFSIALGPFDTNLPTYLPTAAGLRSIVIGGGGNRADGDYSISIGESTNFQGYLASKPSGASSIAVGFIDAQAEDSIAIGTGILTTWGAGCPGVIDTADGGITVGRRGVQRTAHGLMMGNNNSGLNANPMGLYVAPTSSVVIGRPTLAPAADPVSNATLIGTGTLRTNQVLIGTSVNTGARGIFSDDLKCAVWAPAGTILAEFAWWYTRTSGKTDNKGAYVVTSNAPLTISASNMRNKFMIYNSGAGALALTTPTAAEIIATLPAYCMPGDSFIWPVAADQNDVALTAGAGVTISDALTTQWTTDTVDAFSVVYWLVQMTGAATVDISRVFTGNR